MYTQIRYNYGFKTDSYNDYIKRQEIIGNEARILNAIPVFLIFSFPASLFHYPLFAIFVLFLVDLKANICSDYSLLCSFFFNHFHPFTLSLSYFG